MSRLPILFMLTVCLLTGCVAQAEKLTGRTKVEISRTEIRRIPLSETHRMRIVSCPSKTSPYLLVCLEKTRKQRIEYAVTVYDKGHWVTKTTAIGKWADMVNERPVIGLLYTPFVPIDILLGQGGHRFRDGPIQGSQRVEEDSGEASETTPISGQLVSAQGIGRARTQDNGVVRIAAKRADFANPVRVECANLGLAYDVVQVEKRCSWWELLIAAKTGNTVFGLYSNFKLLFNVLTGRITPIGFVVGLVIDVVSGVIIDSVIDTLIVRCGKCGHDWETKAVASSTTLFICPKCGQRSRVKIHIH